jgi:hypothetical protein
VTRIATLALSALFATTTSAGRTTYSAYMTAKGRAQGPMMGAGRSKSGKMPVISFTMSDLKPENAKAPSTEIVVEFEAVDMLGFKRALSMNEVLTTVEIDAGETTALGRVKIDEKIVLTNAFVKSLTERYSNGQLPTATISFTYGKLEITKDGRTVLSDSDWTR